MSEVLQIRVRGRVQGVGFRAFVEHAAHRLGVAGWVRNLPGGDVEVRARVSPGNKGRFLAALQQGPPMARVHDVDVQPLGPDAPCPDDGFSVRF